MPSVMKRGAILALMVVSMIGCGSIESRYLDVNERAYKAIGVEFLEIVGKSTATDQARGDMMGAIEGAQAHLDASAAAIEADPALEPEAKAAEVAKLKALRDGLDAWRPMLPHLDPEQAQRRADSVLAWRAALDEAKQHREGGPEPGETPPPGGP